MNEHQDPIFLPEPSRALADWAATVATEADPFLRAQALARRLGARVVGAQAEFGFWSPVAAAAAAVALEVLLPIAPPDLTAAAQRVVFRRLLLPLVREGETLWSVVGGLPAGRRDQVGAFYRLVYRSGGDEWQTVQDPLAASIPFGAFAPAELYDMPALFAGRADADYFRTRLPTAPDPDGVARILPPVNILQLHVGTATASGTLGGLADQYRRLAARLAAGTPLTPAEKPYIGYDALQLMPIEPTIEYESGPIFWTVVAQSADRLTVDLRRPDTINWGYDVVVAGSSAINPVYLGTGRPDELLDLLVTLHTFPGRPIQLILDVVYGHIDNQGLALLDPAFFAGANMYGQNVAYRHPMVRALLLEMQRRKSDYGVDGLRVDGAQDFKNYDPQTGQMVHDDDYLRLMNEVVQEVAGVAYRPFMIFEDGRPWPRDDWELASSYREVTKHLPNVWQWGPLTFAHNTPFLFTFWAQKWWRLREMAQQGREWITGCANHDTLRRGTQVALDARVNTYLGGSLPEIFRRGYDNPAGKLLDYALLPGIPMDFINGSMRAPWSFVRNTDDRYGVKVVSEESRFLHWGVLDDRYAAEPLFPRLKARGFRELAHLRRFLTRLDHAVQATDGVLADVVTLLNSLAPPPLAAPLDVALLKVIAREWMEDVYALCNVAPYASRLDPAHVAFTLAVREFRRQRSWLLDNLTAADRFDYLHPTAGAMIVYGLRTAPDGAEQLLFVANMEGAPRTVTPAALVEHAAAAGGWTPALVTPGLAVAAADAPLTLHDSEGVVFVRAR